MSYLDIFNERNKRNGNSVRDSRMNRTKNAYRKGIVDMPNYFEVAINNSPFSTGVQIVDDSNVRDQKLITCLDYLLKNGDIIDWQGSQWINILTDNMSDIYYRGTLKRCVGQLKWIDSAGVIKSYPFTFKSDTATNFGVADGKVMTLGNERRILIAPLNEDTKKITKSQRFIFDGRCWSVTAIDRISVDGILTLTVDESTIDEAKDNLSLEIADYYGKVASYTLRILNNQLLSINAGKTIQLVTELLNNGELSNSPLLFTSSDNSIATIDTNGLITTHANGVVQITATLAINPSVTASISCIVEFITHDSYSIELVEQPSLFINKTKTFTAQVRNNGIIDPNKFVNWQLFNEDKTSTITDVATITSSSTTQITLKGLEVGFVWLQTNIIGVNQTFWMQIEIKSLI